MWPHKVELLLFASPVVHLGLVCLNLWAAVEYGGIVPIGAVLLLAAYDAAQWLRVNDKAVLLAERMVENEKAAKRRRRRVREYWEQ